MIEIIKTTHIDDILKLQETNNFNIIKNSEENQYIYLLKKDNNIIGYLAASFLFDHYDISSVLIDKNYRCNSYASLLIEYFLKENSNYDIFLEVRKSNIPAIKLYTKHNFKQISIRKNYYKNPNEDALIFKYII